MPTELALLPDIPVSNNGIISLPVTAAANFRVVFLPDSLSPPPHPSICQTLNVCWNSHSPPLKTPYLPTSSAFVPPVSFFGNSLSLATLSLEHTAFLFSIPNTFFSGKSSSISLYWVWSCFHRTSVMFCYPFLVQSFICLLGEHLLRTCSGQSPELGVGDSEIIRIWFLACRRLHSSWGDRN